MNLVAFSAAAEAATGLILIVDPSVVVWLLFRGNLSAAGLALGRVAGFSLLALGIACWPGWTQEGSHSGAVRGLLSWNALATTFFLYLVLRGELVGLLLWPALIAHAVLAVLLSRVMVLEGKLTL